MVFDPPVLVPGMREILDITSQKGMMKERRLPAIVRNCEEPNVVVMRLETEIVTVKEIIRDT